ncbi:ankyrin repeat domain-containing protein [Roseateles sp. GG27B]
MDRVKKSAAVYAAGSGCSECLRQLIAAGVAVNAPLDNQLTLLMWAAAYGHEASVRLLLAEGADRKLLDDRSKSAADMAREGNHTAVVALLARLETAALRFEPPIAGAMHPQPGLRRHGKVGRVIPPSVAEGTRPASVVACGI